MGNGFSTFYPANTPENGMWLEAGKTPDDSGSTGLSGDYAGTGAKLKVSPPNQSRRNAVKPPEPWRPNAWESAILGAIDAFTQSIISGDIKQALRNAFAALARGVVNAVTETVSRSMGGGFGGAVAGMLAGGLVGWGLSKLFKLGGSGNSRGPDEKNKPVIVAVSNWPDALKHWVLPSSAYFQPTGLYNPRGVIQHNANTINVSAGPKIASRIQRALTDQAFQDQLARGLV